MGISVNMYTFSKYANSTEQPEAALEQDDIFGEEALGYTVMNQWSATTPFNAKGGYSNVFFHFTDRFWNDFTDRFWNDFTENGLALLLD